MSRIVNVLIGPELLWLFFYLLVILIIRSTSSPIKSMDSFWISTAWVVPFVLVPLTFLLYYVPGVIRPWLIIRMWLSCLVIGHFVLNRSLQSHSEQGPGVGTAYMMGMIFMFIPLIAGTIWARIKF